MCINLKVFLLPACFLFLTACQSIPFNVVGWHGDKSVSKSGKSYEQVYETTSDNLHNDLKKIALKMIDLMIFEATRGDFTHKRRPIIGIFSIENKTDEQMDMESIIHAIRNRLVRSGKFKYKTVNFEAFSLKTEYDLNIKKASALIRQYGYDFLIFGHFLMPDHKEKFYRFSLNLVGGENEPKHWFNEVQIKMLNIN